MTAVLTKRRFSVDEYYRLAETGILHPDERVELVDGEIVVMSAIGSAHAWCVRRLNRWFSTRVGDRALVSAQNPVRLSPYSEPEPDLALLQPRPDEYRAAHPGPEDVLLLIEVSDTTLRYDREVKLPLYAAAGIPEVWIVDLPRRRVEVYREPRGDTYQSAAVYEPGAVLSPAAFPDLHLRCDGVVG